MAKPSRANELNRKIATQRKNKQTRTKREMSLVDRYLQSPSLAERIVRGDMPIPGPGLALGGVMGIARYTGMSLAGRAIREAAQRMASRPAPAAPVSPWVRRAQGGNLPTKDMTTSRAPRPDNISAGDVLRGNPVIAQGMITEMGRTARSEMNKARSKRKSEARPKPTAKATKRSAVKYPDSQRRKIVASKNVRTKGRSAPTTTRTAKRSGGARVK